LATSDFTRIHLVTPHPKQSLDPADIAAEVLETVRECSQALSDPKRKADYSKRQHYWRSDKDLWSRSQWLLRFCRESIDRALAAGSAASGCPVKGAITRLRNPADGIPPIPAVEAVQCS